MSLLALRTGLWGDEDEKFLDALHDATQAVKHQLGLDKSGPAPRTREDSRQHALTLRSERTVAGFLLRNPGALRLCEELSPAHFTDPLCREIFAGLVEGCDPKDCLIPLRELPSCRPRRFQVIVQALIVAAAGRGERMTGT